MLCLVLSHPAVVTLDLRDLTPGAEGRGCWSGVSIELTFSPCMILHGRYRRATTKLTKLI